MIYMLILILAAFFWKLMNDGQWWPPSDGWGTVGPQDYHSWIP